MIPPPNPFSNAPPSVRTTTLAAPSLSLTGSRSPGYSSNSYSHSTSPSTGSGSLPEIHNHDGSGMMMSPTQISSASLNAQKRAYRQRRKDPSCDACRERKVKCDATETSACSECSSRNHKCQFTKETNRRMSSIKQVQDLQSQIAELTQLNSHLRTKATTEDGGEPERMDAKRRRSEVQLGPAPITCRIAAPIMRDFDHVRDNIRAYSQGIYNIPDQVASSPVPSGSALPELPPRAAFAQLSRSYLDSVHEWYPILHWPMFQRAVDEAYVEGSLKGKPREWLALFFAVLACGSLRHEETHHGGDISKRKGVSYFETASQSLMPWSQNISTGHVQAAFLLSIFAGEHNWRSVGSLWLGSAVRAAQELNIHCENDVSSAVDSEIRRRLWWALYARDRITSLDSHRPMLIHEEDCETPLPSAIEDRYIQQQGHYRSSSNSTPCIGSLAVIHITRLYTTLYQALKSSVVHPQVLQNLDEQFRTKAMLMPDAYRGGSGAALDTTAIPPLFTLLSAQFHLYRRNLTPTCHPPERAEALSRCIAVAQDTARYISRILHSPPKPDSDKSWPTRVTLVASNMVCLHLWRCMLVLCFHGDYDAALMCLHLSSAIGNARRLNIECGKYTIFFLEQLLNRVRSGSGSPQQLEHDEEILAYVSADAQGSSEHSWVWTGASMASPTSSQRSPLSSNRPDEVMRDALPLRPMSISPKHSASAWDEWGRIEHMIRQLIEENRPRTATYYPAQHNPVKRVQLAPEAQASVKPSPAPNPTPSSSSRISIANII
ncbi:hypothetical protein CC86DRAFT_465979 [Ophiobolus disseminans]|uniref:Zn(2)-C6 fungal-type domain-containing protein n=1 Tax=Ophiobolus disseminans TaxID=1469910 RepID=A0A6A7A4M6_9PLEO|nr:hypothetical protein CC86DRAFT_465979 [Ophiobolus disseminans]